VPESETGGTAVERGIKPMAIIDTTQENLSTVRRNRWV
jgi:hypothetical protein